MDLNLDSDSDNFDR